MMPGIVGSEGSGFNYNAKAGLLAVLSLLTFTTIKYFPSGLLKYPSDMFYGILRAMAFFYLCFLVFLCFLTREQVQVFFRDFVDQGLRQPLPEKHYA